VPKHEIFHPAGHLLPPELKDLFLRYFGQRDLSRLERLGGKVLISITVGSRMRGKKRHSRGIDQSFVKKMQALKNKPQELESVLSELTVKQLRELASLLDKTLPSKITAPQIRQELIECLRSVDFWHGISGTKPRML